MKTKLFAVACFGASIGMFVGLSLGIKLGIVATIITLGTIYIFSNFETQPWNYPKHEMQTVRTGTSISKNCSKTCRDKKDAMHH